jgi:NADH-quinone oxidoreductase subunit H
MAEYGSMFAVSGLAALLFLGGWHTGFLPFEPTERCGIWIGSVFNAAVFITKGYLLVFVMMWMRWSLPRLRIDQVMMTCLKYFLPMSCVLLLGVCLWQLLVSPSIADAVRYILAGSVALGFIVLVIQLLRPIPNSAPAGELAGVWARTTPNP